jgi:hypothetical protein
MFGLHNSLLIPESLDHIVNFDCMVLRHLPQLLLQLFQRIARISLQRFDLLVQIGYYVVESFLFPRGLLCFLLSLLPGLFKRILKI